MLLRCGSICTLDTLALKQARWAKACCLAREKYQAGKMGMQLSQDACIQPHFSDSETPSKGLRAEPALIPGPLGRDRGTLFSWPALGHQVELERGARRHGCI